MPQNRKPDPLNTDIIKFLEEYERQVKDILIKNAAAAFIAGDLKAQAALEIKLSFDLVNQEALKYLKKYTADLERGGTIIQNEFIPWLEDRAKEDRSEIARIIEEGYKAGKPTGVKQYREAGKYGLYPKNSIAGDLQGFFTARKSHAAAVARTEIARIQTHGSLNRYRKQGVSKVIWLVFHPCELCEPYSRRVFDIDKLPYEVPRHVNCRCALAPVSDEVPTGPAPNLKIHEVFERSGKAL